MTRRIDAWARRMLEREGSFATLATLMRDGSPHQAVIWYLLRGDVIVINSAVGRVWPANLMRDPRCSLVIEAGYEWVGVRGRVEAVRDQETAQADIAEMAHCYHADDPGKAERLISERFERQERISFLLHPTAITEHPED